MNGRLRPQFAMIISADLNVCFHFTDFHTCFDGRLPCSCRQKRLSWKCLQVGLFFVLLSALTVRQTITKNYNIATTFTASKH